MQDIVASTKTHLQKVFEVIKNDIATIRTGRATPTLIENLAVEVYGGTTKMRMMELATIGTSDAQTLVITPFDPTIIQEIAKGIQDANLGFNPGVDGHIIRIVIPPLTQERRQELIKAMKHKLENGKIMIRQVRHEALNDIKKEKENAGLSDDDATRIEKDVQKIIEDSVSLIESMGKQKEEELLQL